MADTLLARLEQLRKETAFLPDCDSDLDTVYSHVDVYRADAVLALCRAWQDKQIEWQRKYELVVADRNHAVARQAALETALAERQAEQGQIREKAEALVKAIDVLLNDGQFKSLFVVAHVHGMNYSGPQIGNELEALRAALAAPATAEE